MSMKLPKRKRPYKKCTVKKDQRQDVNIKALVDSSVLKAENLPRPQYVDLTQYPTQPLEGQQALLDAREQSREAEKELRKQLKAIGWQKVEGMSVQQLLDAAAQTQEFSKKAKKPSAAEPPPRGGAAEGTERRGQMTPVELMAVVVAAMLGILGVLSGTKRKVCVEISKDPTVRISTAPVAGISLEPSKPE